MIHKLTSEELELFFVQAWLIWSQRNMVIHGGKLQDPSLLVQRASDFLKEYKEAQVQLEVPTSVPRVSNWHPLTGNSFKLNFNAAIF